MAAGEWLTPMADGTKEMKLKLFDNHEKKGYSGFPPVCVATNNKRFSRTFHPFSLGTCSGGI